MRYKLVLIFCFITFANSSFAQTYKIADSIFRANKHNLYLPAISKDFPEIDIYDSYRIQKAYIEKNLKYDKKSGFKAAITSKKSQDEFSLDSPISGVLFESGKTYSPSIIKSSDFRNLMIETELGFLVKNDIKEILESAEDLKKFISDVYAIVELPDIGFKEIKGLNAIDIISINTGASKYILGKNVRIDSIDINNLKMKLFLDGRLISSGISSEVMGGQTSVLLWLINDTISRGWKIESGNILITGRVGKLNNSKPGLYMADFSQLGKIYFEIR